MTSDPPRLTASAIANSLFRAAIGAMTVIAIVRLDIREPPAIVLAALAAAAWLCLASVFHVAAVVVVQMSSLDRRGLRIPLRFTGSTGRFVLHRLGRSRVEVRAGAEIMAELIADGRGDELVVYDVAHISAEELPELGSAIGQAMEIASHRGQ